MDILPNNEPCPHCGRYNNRRIAVDALIIRDGKILLIKRLVKPFKDFWALPGGGIDFDETAEEALHKEVIEETGLKLLSSKFLQVYTDPKRDPKQVITLSYYVEAEGEPKAGDDAKEYQWFELNNLPELGFDHANIINDYVKHDHKTI
jgi:8-oxo-dGTP diphosphatase